MSYLKYLMFGVFVVVLLIVCSQLAVDDVVQDSVVVLAVESVLNDVVIVVSDVVEMESDCLNVWFQQVFDEGVVELFMYQIFLGMKMNYDQWDDLLLEEELCQYECGCEQYVYMLVNFDFDVLDCFVQIFWCFVEYNNVWVEVGCQWIDYGYIFMLCFGLYMNMFIFMINNYWVDMLEDVEVYIGCLCNMGVYLDQYIVNFCCFVELGVYILCWIYQLMIVILCNIIIGVLFDESCEDSLLMGDFCCKVMVLELSEEDINCFLDEVVVVFIEIVVFVYGCIIVLFEE